MNTYIKQAGLFGIALMVTVGVSYASAVIGWTGPSVTPAGVNAAPPITTGSSTQTKLGSLILNAAIPIQNAIGLTVFGTSTFNGTIQVNPGSAVVVGSILAAADATGDAAWVSPSSITTSSGGLTSMYAFTSSGSWTAPAGITRVRVSLVGGGGGAGGTACGNPIVPSNGGPGGYAEAVMTVVPGQAYTVTVGGVGTPNSGVSTGTSGGASTFNGVTANGGPGASCSPHPSIGTGSGPAGTIVSAASTLPTDSDGFTMNVYPNNIYGYGKGGVRTPSSGNSVASGGIVILEY